MNNDQLWKNALTEIELGISKANFSTWFKNTHIVKQDGGLVYVGVPNEFVKEWLNNKYHKFILKSLRGAYENVRGVEYIICKDIQKENHHKEERRVEIPVGVYGGLPLDDLYINKEDNLNPRYTFDSFVIGSFNELAHAASQAVIKKPGLVYNPLFIYGKTGLGKTHLIQSIGNHIKNINSGKRIHYITSEKFSLDYINSLQVNKINQFKEKYRKYDILIMDDIQFLSNKEKTQEELFHLFNTLYDNNKQIIFSSDQHPAYIPALEERLKSRFSAGMTIDISAPDFESKLAILKAKSSVNNFSLADDIYEYLAANIEGSIRELEGVLNIIMCQSQLKNKDLSINDIKSLIKNNARPQKSVTVKDIVKIVSDFYSINEESIYEKTRKKEVPRLPASETNSR